MSTDLEEEGVQARWAAGCVVSWSLLGCAGLPWPVDLPGAWGPIPLEHDLEGAAAMAAASLSDRIEGGTFPVEILDDCAEHADRLTWLAARHDEGNVISASLWAMAACAEHVHPVDAAAVATARLNSQDRGVLGGAMAVTSQQIVALPVDHPLVGQLVSLAAEHKDLAVRIEALEALDRRSWGQEPAVATAFYAALQAEDQPVLVSVALQRLRYRAAGLTPIDRPRFKVAALVLAGDIDPAVRGLAALALARIAPNDEDVRAQVLILLEDAHGYTRSAAAEALADMGFVPAIHTLVGGLPDETRNTWKMLPWVRLDGSEDRLQFSGSRFERVDDAWLRAIERLTVDLDEPYVMREINLRYVGLDLISASRDATRWYAANGEGIAGR